MVNKGGSFSRFSLPGSIAIMYYSEAILVDTIASAELIISTISVHHRRHSQYYASIDDVHTKLYTKNVIFEWDFKKNAESIDKHRISFEQAQEVFRDPLHLSVLDERFSNFEERWVTMGATENGEVVVVAHLYFVEEPEEKVRIISARRAAPRERRQYEKVE